MVVPSRSARLACVSLACSLALRTDSRKFTSTLNQIKPWVDTKHDLAYLDYMKFSPEPRTWLKELRVSHGLTQKQLGELVGLSSDVAVLYWESGQSRPPYDKMVKLSDILGAQVMERFEQEVRQQIQEGA